MKAHIIDVTRCDGCGDCRLACASWQSSDGSLAAAPLAGGNPALIEIREIQGDSDGTTAYLPILCQQCETPSCADWCPIVGTITQCKDGGIVIDADACIGCESCMDGCHYGAIHYNDDLQIVQRCALCSHLDDTSQDEPPCVKACNAGVLTFGEESELAGLIGTAQHLYPENNTGPRVYYIGLPKRRYFRH